LDYLKIPYTGCPTEGIFLTSNKIIAKRMLRAHNVPTPEWATVGDADNADTTSDKPFIIKSVWGHGSSIISEDSVVALPDKKQLEKELKARFKSFDDYFFAENYIDGREFTIPILSKNGRPEVMPPGEMQFLNYPEDKLKIIEYKTKWTEDSFEYNNCYRKFDVSDVDKQLFKQLKKIAIKCWNIFKLNGYARIDVRVDNLGNPFVLDINTNPYIASGINSSFIASAEEIGLTYEDVIKRIIGHLVYFRRRHHLI
jgi:D-alanine-D-alanine ligase